MTACVLSQLQSCLTLCNTMNCIPPGSSVYGILQARIQEWVAVPSASPGIKLTSFTSPALAGGFFTTSTIWENRFSK